MADKKKNRKPMTSQRKGLIAMIVMLVLTLCVSWLAVFGMKLDSAGVNVLLPWVPVTAGNMPKSLTLGLDLSEGGNHQISYKLVTPAPTAAPTAEPTAEPVAEEATVTDAEAGNGSAGAEATQQPAQNAAEAVQNAAQEATQAVTEAVTEAVQNAAATVEGAADAAGAAAQEVTQAVTEAVTEAVQNAAATVEGAADAAGAAAQEATQAVTEAVTEAVEGAAEAVTEAVATEAPTPAPTATPIPAEFRGELENAVSIIRKRVDAMGRSANVEIINEKSIKVSYPNYVSVSADENVAEAIAMCAETTGEVSLRDASGNVLTDENGKPLFNNASFASFSVDYINYSGAAMYRTIMNLTREGRQAVEGLADQNSTYLYLDGSQMAPIGSIYNDGRVYLSFSNATTANAYGAIMQYGPLTITATAHNEAESYATKGALHAVLIVMWAVFLCACAYMIIRNRMAGLGMAWALWLFVVFFFFLIATVALPTLTIFNWIAVILCVCAAAYIGLVQLKSMDESIAAGRDARSSVRSGFHGTVKQVMIVHGGWLVLSLVLMILPVTRHFGYILCCGVLASLAAMVGLSRWFVPCLVIVAGSKRSSVSAKAGK